MDPWTCDRRGSEECLRRDRRPKCTTYSISKAAVDMLTVHQSEQLKDRGIKVICMDPGKLIF